MAPEASPDFIGELLQRVLPGAFVLIYQQPNSRSEESALVSSHMSASQLVAVLEDTAEEIRNAEGRPL